MKHKTFIRVVSIALALWVLCDDALLLSIGASFHIDKTGNCITDSSHHVNRDGTTHFINNCNTSTNFTEILLRKIIILNDFQKNSFVSNSIWQPPEIQI